MRRKSAFKQQEVYEKIKEAIITEQYQADQRLSSRELCKKFNVSRTPVSEALKRLAYEGFVYAVPDKGSFVSRVRIEDFIELYEIRMGLESIAAGLCAIRKTDSLVSMMENTLKQYEEEFKKGNFLKAIQKDDEFHLLFIAGSKNARLESYLRIIIEQCNRAMSISATNPERIEKIIIPTHRNIFRAIANGDPGLAELATKEHLAHVMEYFKKYQVLNAFDLS